jgi:hypothetical protein
MARSGRKTIKIKAPLMMTSDKVAVWMDQGEWALDFFGWLQKEKGSMGLKGYSHMHGYMKLFFETPEQCTAFGLKYAGRKE